MGMDKYTAAGADRSAGAESDEMSQSRDRVHDMLGAVSSHVQRTDSTESVDVYRVGII